MNARGRRQLPFTALRRAPGLPRLIDLVFGVVQQPCLVVCSSDDPLAFDLLFDAGDPLVKFGDLELDFSGAGTDLGAEFLAQTFDLTAVEEDAEHYNDESRDWTHRDDEHLFVAHYLASNRTSK